MISQLNNLLIEWLVNLLVNRVNSWSVDSFHSQLESLITLKIDFR